MSRKNAFAPAVENDYMTATQLAKRWNVERDVVLQMISARQIPQAFVVDGPAKIAVMDFGQRNLIDDKSPPELVDIPKSSLAELAVYGYWQTRVLVARAWWLPSMFIWPFAHVRSVYERVENGRNCAAQLLDRCRSGAKADQETIVSSLQWRGLPRSEKDAPLVYVLMFHQENSTVEGQDSVLIATADVQAFEREQGATFAKETQVLRDVQLSKARCQALAFALLSKEKAGKPPPNSAELARHEWMVKFGCVGGKRYTPGTIRKWIAEVHPDNRVGRPPKV